MSDAREFAEPSDAARGARAADELTEATARGLRWIAASRIGTEVLLMGSMVVLARVVKPAAFGDFTLAVIVQMLALGIPAEGVGSALVQRNEVTRGHLQAGFAMAMLGAVVLAVLTWVLADVVVQPVFGAPAAELVRLSTPMYLLAAFGAVPVAVLRRKLDFRRLSQIELVASVGRSVGPLVFVVVFGMQGAGLVLGGLVAGTIATAVTCIWSPPPLPRLRRREARDILAYGSFGSVAAICWAGFANGDYAVLNAKLGAAAAGMYWRSYTLAVEYQRKVTVVTNTVGFPMLSRAEDMRAVAALRRRMVRMMSVVMFPLLLGLAVTAPVLIPFVFGRTWLPAIVPTQVLCAAGAVTLVIEAAGSALMALGRARSVLLYGFAHFVVYVGTVILVAHLGLTAVAIDAATIHGAFLIVMYAMVLRGTGERTLSGLWRDIGPALRCCAVMAAAMLAVDFPCAQEGVPTIPRLAAIASVGVVSYVATLRVVSPASWGDVLALAKRLLPERVVRSLQLLGGRVRSRAAVLMER